ncbi:MAG: 3D domain-containing protein [Lachnospiraceae bacterium]
MEKKGSIKTVIGIILLVFFAGFIAVLGYRVVATADEVPGKLGSVSVAAANLGYSGCTMKKVQKVSYDTMKYGYMDDLLLAQMDELDQHYASERMEEIRAINNLTAMSEKTADKLAYEQAKAERDEAERKAKEAAKLAEAAKAAKIQAITQQIKNGNSGNSSSVSTGGSGDTASKGGRKGEPVYTSTHGESLGKFVITAYCTCRICCGVYSGGNRTASGTVPTSNRTIAVDTSVIPFGTKVVINGQIYVAEDRGGAIKGKRIDMFFMTHSEALRWGRRTIEVYLAD